MRAQREVQDVRLSGVPRLPQGYSPRIGVVEEVSKLLMSGSRFVSLQGQGGLGKSVIASAVAQEIVMSSFDSVEWITVGQNPAILTLQAELSSRVLSSSENFIEITDIKDGQTKLRRLFQGRRTLLILDDVWKAEEAEMFFGLPLEQNSVLVTTRLCSLFDSHEVQEYRLSLMTEKECLCLLEQDDLNPCPVKGKIISFLDKLTLGLSVLGATQKETKVSFSELYELMRKADSSGCPRNMTALEVSINLLEEHDKLICLELAVFPEDVCVPLSVILRFQSSKGKTEDEVLDCIKRLISLKLVQLDLIWDGTQENSDKRDLKYCRVSLHDVVVEYLKRRNNDLNSLHNRLIFSYKSKLTSHSDNPDMVKWEDGPNDGYFFHYLLYHLEAIGNVNEIKNLTQRFSWLIRKFQSTKSIYSILLDFRTYFGKQENKNKSCRHIEDALQLSAHVLIKYPEQFAFEMFTRMKYGSCEHCNMKKFIQDANDYLHQGTFQISSDTENPINAFLLPLNENFTMLSNINSPIKKTMTSHSDWVRCVSFSPSGSYIASGGNDFTVKIFKTNDGSLLYDLLGHTANVIKLEWLNNENIVSLSQNSMIRIFKIPKASGGEDGPVAACILTKLLLDTFDPTKHLEEKLNVNTFCLLRKSKKCKKARGKQSKAEDICIAFSLDSEIYLGTLAETKKLMIAQSTKALANSSSENEISCFAVSKTNTILISGDLSGNIAFWDIKAAPKVSCIKAHSEQVSGIVISEKSKQFLTCAHDHLIYFWHLDMAQEKPIRALTGHTDWIHSIAAKPDFSLIITGSDDDSVRFWRRQQKGSEYKSFKLRLFSGQFGVDLLNDGDLAVSASGEVKILDCSDLSLSRLTGGNNSEFEIKDIAIDLDGSRCVSVCRETVTLWDPSNGNQIADMSFQSSDNDIKPTCCSISDFILAVGTNLGKLYIWSTNDRISSSQQSKNIQVHEDEEINTVRLSNNGRFAVTGADDGKICIIDTKSICIVHTLLDENHYVSCCALSQNQIVSGGFNGECKVWSLKGFESNCTVSQPEIALENVHTLKENGTSRIKSLSVSSSGKVAVMVESKGSMLVWDLFAKVLLRVFPNVTEWATRGFSVSLSSCGYLACSIQWDRTLKFWCLRTMRCISTVKCDKSLTKISVSGNWSLDSTAIIAIGNDEGEVHFLSYNVS